MDVDTWTGTRLPSAVRHLDVAAAGRVSRAALAAEVAHLRREAEVGAYVAEDESEPVVLLGRERVASLLGLTSADVALPPNAIDGFAGLLAAWPLPRGSRVGTVASEYGPNASVLRRLAAERGWELVVLPADALGRVRDVPAGLDLLTLPHVASQRGVVQPVDALLAAGVPLLLDVAQSLGQTPVPAGCTAYVGTSRKWLCGPRGVGVLAVDPGFAGELVPPAWSPAVRHGLRRWDAPETHVAGRVGWSVAVQEWSPDLLPVVHAVAAQARELLVETGWTVVEPVTEPTGTTTLVAPAGVDVAIVRERLRARGVLTSAVPVSRAAELTAPVLRVSTAAWVTQDDLAALAEGLLSLASAA